MRIKRSQTQVLFEKNFYNNNALRGRLSCLRSFLLAAVVAWRATVEVPR